MSAPLRLAEPGDLELLTAFIAELYAESGHPLNREAAARALAALVSDRSLDRL